MAWRSTLRPNEIIIDDSYNVQVPPGQSRGLMPRDYDRHPFASGPTKKLDLEVMSESDIKEEAKRKEMNKTRISDIMIQGNLPCKDQNGTNYCWINAPTHCVEYVILASGEGVVSLSPASVGGPIKGYRNSGGWGSEGLEYIVEHGVAPSSIWSDNQWRKPSADVIQRADEERKKYRITEWYDLENRNFLQLCTCLLHNVPVAIGLNWWSHEITGCDVVVMDNGDLGIRIRNSWGMSWGDKGFSVLTRSKATPDDAVAPAVALAIAG